MFHWEVVRNPLLGMGCASALRAACTLPAPTGGGGSPHSPRAEPVSDAACRRSLRGLSGVAKPLFRRLPSHFVAGNSGNAHLPFKFL